MKFDKWTIGLAAVGVVSLASVARADEKVANTVQTALAGTTISGYVDTSAQWNFGTGNANNPPYKFGGPSKADGFNLDVVQLTIAKPLDESEWASGYHVDLWFGPDANTLNTQSTLAHDAFGESTHSDFAIRQAYVNLRTPIGNGVDWKIGVFDSPIGYESVEAGNNPNFTRSYGHSIEPQTLTGLIGTYHLNDIVSFSGGIANTIGPTINGRAFGNNYPTTPNSPDNNKAESYKAYMATLALTAPQSWGWAAGSMLYAGVVSGFNGSQHNAPVPGGTVNYQNSSSYYVGATMATPVTDLKLGFAFDYLDVHNPDQQILGAQGNAWAVSGYASYQATEKLSLHARAEWADDRAYFFSSNPDADVFALTATAQYDLWKNVISRLEFRWDHAAGGGKYFGGTSAGEPTRKNAYMLAANIIYKF